MAQFVKSQPELMVHVLKHIGNSSVAELLLKIISVEEVPEGQGIVAVRVYSQLSANYKT
jgi:hypothetical protein